MSQWHILVLITTQQLVCLGQCAGPFREMSIEFKYAGQKAAIEVD